MNSRCVFVYCDEMKKGFVTRLSQDQRLERIYEQVHELFLIGSDYEVVSVELSEKIESVEWILPPFLRTKDVSFENPLYTKAIIRPKHRNSVLPVMQPLMSIKEIALTSKSRAKVTSSKHIDGVDSKGEDVAKETDSHSKTTTGKSSTASKTSKRSTETQADLTPAPEGDANANETVPTPASTKTIPSSESKQAFLKEAKSKKRSSRSKSNSGISEMNVQTTPEPPAKRARTKQATLTGTKAEAAAPAPKLEAVDETLEDEEEEPVKGTFKNSARKNSKTTVNESDDETSSVTSSDAGSSTVSD